MFVYEYRKKLIVVLKKILKFSNQLAIPVIKKILKAFGITANYVYFSLTRILSLNEQFTKSH